MSAVLPPISSSPRNVEPASSFQLESNSLPLSPNASLASPASVVFGCMSRGSIANAPNNSTAAQQLLHGATSSGTQQQYSAATYGDMFGATIHFWLESIVARCRCDRVALFLPHPKHHTLVRVAMVGPTAQSVATQNAAVSVKPGDPGVAGPVTAAVLQTGVAANLCQVAQEDVLDCPGSSHIKTALVVPVKPLRASAATAAVGVVFAVNKNRGSEVFTTEDQHTIVSIAPSIAYLAETYPVDFSQHRFDAAPLHRIISQTRSAKSSKSVAALAQANTVLPERPPQLVYEQSGNESMLPYVAHALAKSRATASSAAAHSSSSCSNPTTTGSGGGNTNTVDDGANMNNNNNSNNNAEQYDDDSMNDNGKALSTAEQILSVGDFVNKMEQCWREAVSRCIATERELTLRNAQVVDAHAILHRKQRRLEVLKDVLVETMDRRQQFA